MMARNPPALPELWSWIQALSHIYVYIGVHIAVSRLSCLDVSDLHFITFPTGMLFESVVTSLLLADLSIG